MANLISKVFKSKKSKIIGAAVLVAAVAGGSAMYINTQNAKIPAVTLTAVTKGELAKSVTITGNIETNNTNVLSLSPTAKVTSVLVKAGQNVKKGDILAVLDTADYQNQLKQQQINLTNAKTTLAYMTGASSSADKTSTSNAVSQAQIALENAQSNYDAANNNLDSIQGVDDNAVSQAQIALDTANNNYRAAKKNLQNLEDQLQNAKDAVSKAQNTFDNAQNAFNNAQNVLDRANANPPTYIDPVTNTTQLNATTALSDATTALTNAKGALASAKAALASEQNIYDSSSITARQAINNADNAVQSAQVTLDNAQAKADSDSTTAEKAISDADNAVKSAQLALSNAKNTASFTVSTDSNKVTNQKAQIALLNATIENLNSKIEQGNLRANIDGTVTKMDAVANQYPAATDQIVVNGTYQYVVDLKASQYDSVNIMAGQKVNITVHGVSKQYEGTVSEIGQLAATSLTSTNTDPTVDIKISITNPDANVVVGYQADADVILAEKTDAVQVSFEAIQTEQSTGKKYVYVVDSSNRAKKTYIETGIETDYNVEVLSGLADGQKCISNPGTSIKDGIKVRATGGTS